MQGEGSIGEPFDKPVDWQVLQVVGSTQASRQFRSPGPGGADERVGHVGGRDGVLDAAFLEDGDLGGGVRGGHGIVLGLRPPVPPEEPWRVPCRARDPPPGDRKRPAG